MSWRNVCYELEERHINNFANMCFQFLVKNYQLCTPLIRRQPCTHFKLTGVQTNNRQPTSMNKMYTSNVGARVLTITYLVS